MMHQLVPHIIKPMPSVMDLAYTLSKRQSNHAWVAAIPARTMSELANWVQAPAHRSTHSSKCPTTQVRLRRSGGTVACHGPGTHYHIAQSSAKPSTRADEILKLLCVSGAPHQSCRKALPGCKYIFLAHTEKGEGIASCLLSCSDELEPAVCSSGLEYACDLSARH